MIISDRRERKVVWPQRDGWVRRGTRTLFGVMVFCILGLSLAALGQPSAEPATATAGAPDSMEAITAAQAGKIVTLVGKITNKIEPSTPDSRAPYKWYVTDGKGVALVVIFPDDFRQLASPSTRFPIDGRVKVKGKISEYRGQLQVVAGAAEDVQIPPADSPMGVWGLSGKNTEPPAAGSMAAPAKPATLPDTPPEGYLFPGKVTKEMLNQTVKVAGKVANYRESWSDRAPNIVTLEGGGGTLDFVYWRDTDQALGARKPSITTVGSLVKVEGTLSEFRDRLQLRVDKAENMQAWTPAPSAAAAAAATEGSEKKMEGSEMKTEGTESKAAAAPPASASGAALTPSQITKADIDKTVVVRGTVKSVREPSSDRAPYRVTLADDKGTVTVVYWKDQGDLFTGDNAPQEGKPWAVEGKVSEYREQLQVRATAPAK